MDSRPSPRYTEPGTGYGPVPSQGTPVALYIGHADEGGSHGIVAKRLDSISTDQVQGAEASLDAVLLGNPYQHRPLPHARLAPPRHRSRRPERLRRNQ
jgi:hypothetical protein